MSRNSVFKILLILFLLCNQGCTLKSKRTYLPAHITDNEGYLSALLNTSNTAHYLSGKAKLKISSPGKNFTSKTIFFIKPPSSLHVEMLNFFNQPYLFLVADNNDLQLYIPSENKVYFDKASPDNISRIIGIPIDVSDLISIIACRPPSLSLKNSKIFRNEKIEYLIFKIINKSTTDEVWVDKKINRIIKYISYKNGSPQMEIKYSKFKQLSNKLMPSLIELYLPLTNCGLLIEFNSQDFNSFSDDLFNLALPANTQVFPFSAIPAP